jgi:hypothetical protein
MEDLGSEILKKYGTAGVVLTVIFAFLIWLLAHWAAEPGREVSVLWGFVKYTKSSPTSTVKDTSIPIQTQKSNEKDKRETISGSLSQSGPLIRNGVVMENRIAILKSLRNDRNLRELTAVESGKKVRELPAGTYFFLYGGSLSSYGGRETLLMRISEQRADRFPASKNYFEIQNTREGELHLIGYVNELQAAEISRSSITNTREVMVSPLPWGQSTSLVSIPVKRIQDAEPRDVQASEENEIKVIDAKIK